MHTTTNNVIPFEYQGNSIRVVDQDGAPWFVAKDVCDVLGLDNTTNAIRSLNYDERSTITRSKCGLKPGAPLLIISEAGLYKLILRSDKREAKDFQRWVTHEVLPRIRKTGGYIAGEERMDEDELILKAMQVLQRKLDEKQRLIEEQASQLTRLRPKVEAYDDLMDSDGLYSFRNAARVLGMRERDFMTFLRDCEYVTSETPTVAYATCRLAGLFETKAVSSKYNRWSGTQTFLTPKGLDYFRGILLCRKITES